MEPDYKWKDKTDKPVILRFIVKGLTIYITAPTVADNPLKFTGLNGKGTFVMPTLKGTTVKADKQINLSNKAPVVITYTPIGDYKWTESQDNTPIELTFIVGGLKTGIAKPTIATAPINIWWT